MKLKRSAIIYLAITGASALGCAAGAVEIPLGAATVNVAASSETAQGMTGAVGYVDIDRVFREHPLTQRSREEFKQEVEKRRREIDGMRRAITDAESMIVSSTTIIEGERSEIESLRSRAVSAPLTPSTTAQTIFPEAAGGAAPEIIAEKETALKAGESELELMKKNLASMRSDLEARVQKDKEGLVSLEEKQTSDVMADIYHILEKIAREEGITVVFDKNNILYGSTVRDVTEKVLERLKGR